jgi:hypothetical protein
MKQINKYYVYNCLYLMYRRLFRKAVLVVAAVTLSASNDPFAQASNLHGAWTGKLFMKNETVSSPIELSFNNNSLLSVSDDMNKPAWFGKAKMNVKEDKNSITFTWTENSEFGVHSEIYKISMVNADSATLNWSRHCVIYNSGKRSKSDTWDITASGYLLKTPALKGIEITGQ